jgi:lysophospholipase L1-like esterase
MILAASAASAANSKPGGTLHFLALGDSYTIGESVAPEARWPVVLAAQLRQGGLDVAEPDIVARTGWTTDELEDGIAESELRAKYDLVTLLIGVNNQYRGRPAGEYRQQFRRLLDKARHFAGGHASRVIVVSIPDWGVTPFARNRDGGAIAAQIDEFNAINRDEAARAKAHWVDVTEISRQATIDPKLVADDGLHPSAAMYRLWVEEILPVAKAALGTN